MSTSRHLELLARVREVQDQLRFPVTDRAMFGGTMLYADGRPLASLSRAGFAVKLPPDGQEVLLRLPGAHRLQYRDSDTPSRQYVVLPDSVLLDDEQLVAWLERSAAHVAGTPRDGTGVDRARREATGR